ncbi:MAG: hypothetical protein KC620_15950 [Myxococcales bacterium]|nr:hypothetical protein [Myxococcales bacterium]
MRRLIPLLLLAGCGAAPMPTPSTAPAGPDAKLVAARGVPGALSWRLLVLAGPGVDDLGFFPAYYGMVAAGWRVRVATPVPEGARSARGLPVPADLTIAQAKPADFDP